MDKKRLEEYRDLKKEIELYTQKVKELEKKGEQVATDMVTGSYIQHPYIKHGIKITGIDVVEKGKRLRSLKRIRGLIEGKKIEAEVELERLYKHIMLVPSSQLRQILVYRYVDGLTWPVIAKKIGETDEQYPRKKIDKYLKSTEKTE